MAERYLKIIVFLIFVFLCLPCNVFGASKQGNKMADTGAKIACGTSRIYAYWSSTKIYNDITKKYVDARDKYIVNAANDDGSYASCDVGVATIVRSSGVDPNFEAFLVPNQLRYLDGNSDWKRVGIYYKGTNTASLEPGDVLIVDSAINTSSNVYGHIWMYLGNEAVRKYYPDSNADSVEAGYNSYPNGSYYPTLFNAEENLYGDSRTYVIFRFNGIDYVEGVLNWANQTSQSFIYNAVNPCDIISGEISEFLNNLFMYISVGGIILVVILSMIDLIKVIVGRDDTGLKNFFNNLKSRVIVVIILLLLPVILSYVIEFINYIAPILGYDSDNPLCKLW